MGKLGKSPSGINVSQLARIKSNGTSKPARNSPYVAVIRNYEDTAKACAILKESTGKLLSFDTETTVTRKKHVGVPSVIQLATFKHCFIFQIYRMLPGGCSRGRTLPKPLEEILASSALIKVGVGAIQDSKELEDKFSTIKLSSVFDLQFLLEALRLPASISKFSKEFSLPVYQEKPTDQKAIWKAHLKRNWDYELNMEEINYASKDVFAVLSGLRSLIRNPQPTLLNMDKIDFGTILQPFDN